MIWSWTTFCNFHTPSEFSRPSCYCSWRRKIWTARVGLSRLPPPKLQCPGRPWSAPSAPESPLRRAGIAAGTPHPGYQQDRLMSPWSAPPSRVFSNFDIKVQCTYRSTSTLAEDKNVLHIRSSSEKLHLAWQIVTFLVTSDVSTGFNDAPCYLTWASNICQLKLAAPRGCRQFMVTYITWPWTWVPPQFWPRIQACSSK